MSRLGFVCPLDWMEEKKIVGLPPMQAYALLFLQFPLHSRLRSVLINTFLILTLSGPELPVTDVRSTSRRKTRTSALENNYARLQEIHRIFIRLFYLYEVVTPFLHWGSSAFF